MDLRWVRYFVTTADVGTVSGAAEALHLTQPGLSRQLRQLERDLGLDLFTRSRGRLQLSAAGREFLPLARDLVARADALRQAATGLSGGGLDRLALAAPTTTLTDVIAPLLATFGPDDPVPSVVELDPAEAFRAVERGADLAIVTEPPTAPLIGEALAVLPVWAYVRADHPWAGRRRITVTELASQPVLALTPSFRPRRILDGAFALAGLAAAELVETGNAQVAQALAAAGRGVAVVSDDPRFDLVPLEIDGPGGPLRIHLHAGWRADHHAAPTLAALAARLRDFCADRYGPAVRPRS